MDARITKQRLANMLAYDWLKIVGVIALAALFFSMFFLMIGTRPTDGQKFYVYAYSDIKVGGDFNRLADEMESKNVFGYDILDVSCEGFTSTGLYGNSVFTARRAVGEGRVMFMSDKRTVDSEGNEKSELLGFLENKGQSRESFNLFKDPQAFMEDCKSYLEEFFGEDLKGELNRDKARETFLKRNKKDARFRTDKKRESGILLEEARLEKLKEDYLYFTSQIGQKLEYVSYTSNIKTHTVAFSMKELNLTKLVYYTEKQEDGEVQTNSDIVLCLFNNGEREGDLKYETVNFLAYLVRTYGTQE